MAKFSTGLRNAMLDSGSFKDSMDGNMLYIYSGAVPATADAPIGAADLLAVLTVGGDGATGLTFGVASGGVIAKSAAEVWSTTAVEASGTASFWRLASDTDAGDLSTTESRVQGDIGAVGTDMLLTNPALVEAQSFTLNYFNVALPTY